MRDGVEVPSVWPTPYLVRVLTATVCAAGKGFSQYHAGAFRLSFHRQAHADTLFRVVIEGRIVKSMLMSRLRDAALMRAVCREYRAIGLRGNALPEAKYPRIRTDIRSATTLFRDGHK